MLKSMKRSREPFKSKNSRADSVNFTGGSLSSSDDLLFRSRVTKVGFTRERFFFALSRQAAKFFYLSNTLRLRVFAREF